MIHILCIDEVSVAASLTHHFLMGAGLRELFVPYAASSIEKQAFAACTELSIIFLSNRITYIAGDAFEGCSPELTV